MPCYGDERTLDDLRQTFGYIFDNATFPGGGTPQILLTRIVGPFSLGGVEILPVPIFHGPRPILGFRLGSFAYLTDCSRIPDGSWPLLAGVRTLVIDALRERPHPTHFSGRRSDRSGGARRAGTRLLHAHLSRSAARGHLRAPARRHPVGL